ncbi:hypothetical protein ACFQ4C_29765 [Larkinella insperata]|uniref:Uncharacterized protein n=1 Tax=Larkinella insperata TaxID=332158 RepID=A0ABW3QI04_9BACT
MKKLFSILFTGLLTMSLAQGQMINLSGDSETEQAAKLEIIRIIQERIQKMTIAEINSRIVVSKGVTKYYKVEEIEGMYQTMHAQRSAFAQNAVKLKTQSFGMGSYVEEYTGALEKADALRKQLRTVVTSGNMIQLPPLPIFNISFASNSGNAPANDLQQQMTDLMASYGVTSPEDLQNMDPAKKQELEGKLMLMKEELYKQTIAKGNNNATKLMSLVANIIMPGLGSILGGLTSGKNPVNTLVGYVTDNFQMPTEYYTSDALKLTDSERIKIIDELHLRMSELYQKTTALSMNMSNESKKRYNEVIEKRNDMILHGPKN